ncbi:MAG: putative peptidoglycan glycosyltransferase FtsW [Candidatus Paceibacterota bacterium]
MKERRVDFWFLASILALLAAGFIIFISASMGLYARDGASFTHIISRQILFGFVFGGIGLIIMSQVHYRNLRRYAFYLFLASIFVSLFVFVPGIGFESGGARRWISIGSLSFQPSELLKIGFVIYLSAWLSGIKSKMHSFKYGIIPFVLLMGLVSAILLAEPDAGTLLVIGLSAGSMYIAAGANMKDILTLGVIACVFAAIVVAWKPYILDRVMTFANPLSDPQGSGFQVKQSLIAIGSGQVFGRGFGQSVQKFSYLPEPIGDSIFAVAGEEFGFVGSTTLLALFTTFLLLGLRIAKHAPDLFGGLLVVGIVILIVSQSLINIASMLGVFPLSGMPLIFVSHGGTALAVTLTSLGIVLNVSKYQRI